MQPRDREYITPNDASSRTTRRIPAQIIVSGSTRWPSTSRHLPQCEHRDTIDPAIVKAILRVHDREGYWWVECVACDCGWQVPYYVAESVR